MKTNEWGVEPGTQDNITPDDAPMLSERECTLVNLFRAFDSAKGQEIIKYMFGALLNNNRK